MRRTFAFSLIAISLLAFVQEASAQRRVSLEEGPIVRRKLLFRSSRFEVTPRIGSTVGDSYKRNLMLGVDLNYHLTNEFGLGISGSFGALQVDTGLLDQINSTLDVRDTSNLSYASVQMLVDAHISYVPIYGKFALFSGIFDYDIHVLGGFGGAIIQAEGGALNEELSGFKPAPMFGGGGRVFIGDSVAITLDVRDYLYSSAEIQEGDKKPTSEFGNHVTVSMGLAFFFPGEVKVSR